MIGGPEGVGGRRERWTLDKKTQHLLAGWYTASKNDEKKVAA